MASKPTDGTEHVDAIADEAARSLQAGCMRRREVLEGG